jgi:hypothetical protein
MGFTTIYIHIYKAHKVKVKLSLYLTKHNAMKTYWGCGGIAPPRKLKEIKCLSFLFYELGTWSAPIQNSGNQSPEDGCKTNSRTVLSVKYAPNNRQRKYNYGVNSKTSEL